jgi:adenosylcobyric acid synthase
LADLAFLRAQGWDIDILAHHRRGGAVLGICGGYQMLGRSIDDPHGIEGAPGKAPGLGLLNVSTVLGESKMLREVSGTALGAGFAGYEMHMGQTEGYVPPFARFDDGQTDGAISADGLVMGTYCHGLLGSTRLRAALLARLGIASDQRDYAAEVDAALDAVAAALEEHLDMDGLIALARGAA